MNKFSIQNYFFKIGDKHPTIRTIKEFLNGHPQVRHYNLRLNNEFDAQTQVALMDYQKFKFLEQKNGNLTLETYRAFGEEMNVGLVKFMTATEPALHLLLAGNGFGDGDEPSPGDGGTTLPGCAKNAVLEFYNSVGSSSQARLELVKKTLNDIVISFTGFPITTPPGIALKAKASTDAVAGAGTYKKLFGQDPEDIEGYTASSERIYIKSGIGGFPMFRTANGLSLLTHEFTHAMQYLEEKNFSINYVKEMLKHGSSKGGNRFEERAYTNGEKSKTFYLNNPGLLCNDKYSN